MKRIGLPLEPQMQDPTIANLQAALTLLGLTIVPVEKKEQRYGPSIRQAVRQFQAERQLPVTGAVDEATASLLNAILAERGVLDDEDGSDPPPPVEPTLYSIEGEVVQTDGTPLPNYPVRAFDRALGDWRLLGEACSNAVGRYNISYEPEQLKAWGKTRADLADLKVEAYDAAMGDMVLAISPLILQENPEALDLFPDGQAGKAELLRVEQLFHLTLPQDKLAVMQPLWKARLRSAPQIALFGRQKLLRLPGGLDRKVANRLYRQAAHITSVALHVYARYHPQLNCLLPYAVRPLRRPREQALARAATTLPEWEELFGSTDACACSHCEAALSPAAYLSWT